LNIEVIASDMTLVLNISNPIRESAFSWRRSVLFREIGYQKTTVADIAKVCG